MSTTAIPEDTIEPVELLRRALHRPALLDRTRSEFFREWLQELATYCGASGAIARLRDERGEWVIGASFAFPDLSVGTEHAAERHGRLVFETFVTGRPKIIPPQLGTRGDLQANPTDGLLLIGLLQVGTQARGVVELVLPPGLNADRQLEVLAGVQLAGEAIKAYEDRQRNAAQTRREIIADAVEGYCRAIYKELSVARVAYAAVNEGKRLLNCERLTIVVRRGNHFQVEAVSGLDVVERRSVAAKELASMAWTVSGGLEPAHYPNADEPLAPQIQSALGEYVDHSYARRVSVLPLVKPANEEAQTSRPALPLGALIVEWFGEVSAPPGYPDRCRFAAEHAAAALDKARQFESVPGFRIWTRVAAWRENTERMKRIKAAAFVVVPALIVLALVLIPSDFTIHATGSLRPARNQFAFAPSEGVIKRIFVRHGDRVTVDQPLLEMRNVDLEVELSELTGRRRAAQEQLAGVERSLYEDSTKLTISERHRLSADRSRLRQETAAYDEQLRLLERKKDQLLVRSPLAGEILTWDVEKRLLHRPVQPGQSLLEIGDVEGAWALELEVPEDDIGHIAAAAGEASVPLLIRYRLAATPQSDYYAAVEEIHSAAEVRGDAGNTVLVRARLDDERSPPLRAGAEAVAKVHCGRRSLGYVWLHDALDFLRTKVWFRLS